MSNPKVFISNNEDDTKKFAKDFASKLNNKTVVVLNW